MPTAQAAILKKTKRKPDLPLTMGSDNDHVISSNVIARSYYPPHHSPVGLIKETMTMRMVIIF